MAGSPLLRQSRARRMGHAFLPLRLPLSQRRVEWGPPGLFLAARPFQAAGDDNLLRDFFVDWGDVVVSGTAMEGADDRRIAAGKHTQDAALGAAIFLLASELYQHLVAVHG